MASGTIAVEIEGAPREVVGFGLELLHNGKLWRLGRSEWCQQERISVFQPGGATVPNERLGLADCAFSCEGVVLASFRFSEQIRPDAREELAFLQQRGYPVHILSGDRAEKVAAMAVQLGLDPEQSHGGMTPQQKEEWVRGIDCEDTLMIGDGANDSLAFNASYCTGTPAVDRGLLEKKADFYFLGRGLCGLRSLLDIAFLRQQTNRLVIAFAITYNCVAITICLNGSMNPLLASILMPLSSLASIGLVLAAFKLHK